MIVIWYRSLLQWIMIVSTIMVVLNMCQTANGFGFLPRFGLSTCNTRMRRPEQASSGRCLWASNKFNYDELYSRIDNLQKQESQLLEGIVPLPVIYFDALLPRQRLEGRTTDETFGALLSQIGIGGVFGMVSLDFKQRKLRRNGVLCKIQVVDAPSSSSSNTETASGNGVPTAVDFAIVGLQPCRLVGPNADMQARVGRWRRGYDPDGEESVLGWGMERFVNVVKRKKKAEDEMDDFVSSKEEKEDDNSLPSTKWSNVQVQLSQLEDPDEQNAETLALAQEIPALLDEWQQVASQESTYENTDVVATVRYRHGHAGLSVYPDALLRKVRAELGPVPPTTTSPTALALYGAALINPLPALGVSPEIRGRVLSAPTALEKLKILKWSIERSLKNLRGIQPL